MYCKHSVLTRQTCALLLDDRRRLLVYLLHEQLKRGQLQLPLGVEKLEVTCVRCAS